jgi:hypothetical protein
VKKTGKVIKAWMVVDGKGEPSNDAWDPDAIIVYKKKRAEYLLIGESFARIEIEIC